MNTIFVVCDQNHQANAISKIKASFPFATAIAVSSLKELNAKLPDWSPRQRNTGILLVSKLHNSWEYWGFPCAPMFYSQTDEGKICEIGDCWWNAVSFLRQKASEA